MKRPSNTKTRNRAVCAVLVLLLLCALGALGWSYWVYTQIEIYAGQDQAAPSDAIGVFGAAEYDGRPSPVYRARLEHARSLYEHGIAPL
ncbi:MAG: YdcF family protein, partial [Terracidiphilus sp.]